MLLLAGDLDPIVTVKDAEELAAALPPTHLRFICFENAGRMLAAEEPVSPGVTCTTARRGYARVADPDAAAAGRVPAFAIDWAFEVLG